MLSATPSKGWHFVAKARDMRADEAKVVTVGERQIAVCRVAGKLYAFDNICSHEFACLSDGLIEGEEIECPLHQARFHIPTGKALSEPATADLAIFAVKEEAGDVLVEAVAKA